MAAPVPISLKDASARVLRGNVSVSALRTEARRGNLDTFKIGKNLYTTEEAIREMIDRCRVQPSQPDSSTDETKTDGSSGTEEETFEPDALDLIGKALKNGSPLTSARSAPPRPAGEVVPMRSQSAKS